MDGWMDGYRKVGGWTRSNKTEAIASRIGQCPERDANARVDITLVQGDALWFSCTHTYLHGGRSAVQHTW